MNIRKALSYIKAYGSALDQARAISLVEFRPATGQILPYLEQLQGQAGGWPVGLEAGRPESIAETVEVLFALLDLGVPEHPMVPRAWTFLLSRQEEDGGWRGDLSQPPEDVARLYMTARVSALLVAYDRAELPPADQVLDLLLNRQQEDGSFEGFRRLTAWQALPLLAARLGKGSGPAQNILRFSSHEMGERDWYPSVFASLLHNLLLAGYGMDLPLVRNTWEQLLLRQSEDGSWAGEQEKDNVCSTLEVMWCWNRITLRR